MIVKKAIRLSVKLLPPAAGRTQPKDVNTTTAARDESPGEGNKTVAGKTDSLKAAGQSAAPVESSLQVRLKAMLEGEVSEKSKGKLQIKVVKITELKDGPVALKLKVTGEAEIAEDFAALTVKAVEDIFKEKENQIYPLKL